MQSRRTKHGRMAASDRRFFIGHFNKLFGGYPSDFQSELKRYLHAGPLESVPLRQAQVVRGSSFITWLIGFDAVGLLPTRRSLFSAGLRARAGRHGRQFVARSGPWASGPTVSWTYRSSSSKRRRIWPAVSSYPPPNRAISSRAACTPRPGDPPTPCCRREGPVVGAWLLVRVAAQVPECHAQPSTCLRD
jgi:hypothetical protein